MKKSLIITEIIALLAFIFLIINVYLGYLIEIDISINALMPKLQLSSIIFFSKVMGILFDTYSMIAISLIISVYLWLKKSKKDAIFFSTLMLVNAAAIEIIKTITQRARPINELVNETNPAFPSGHVTTAVVFFSLLIYLTLKSNSPRKKLYIFLSLLMVLLISFSRLCLNVHWFTDILGGLALGLFIIMTGILAKSI